jgi:hypothetical protein
MLLLTDSSVLYLYYLAHLARPRRTSKSSNTICSIIYIHIYFDDFLKWALSWPSHVVIAQVGFLQQDAAFVKKKTPLSSKSTSQLSNYCCILSPLVCVFPLLGKTERCRECKDMKVVGGASMSGFVGVVLLYICGSLTGPDHRVPVVWLRPDRSWRLLRRPSWSTRLQTGRLSLMGRVTASPSW